MKSWPKIDGALSDYVDANWLRESALKRRLREETGKMKQAGMQISAHQGQQMALLAHAIGAKRAVEVGTFTGYYDAYYERCLKLVRKGGLILIDNVLWGGSVADPSDTDEDTKAIRALNAKLKADERVDLTLFAVGDGMTCAMKR